VPGRLGRRDFIESNLFLNEESFYGPFVWEVYEEYALVEPKDGVPYFNARGFIGRYKPQVAKRYEPLIETPHLFLDFARLWEQRDVSNALVSWIAKYGLLGLASDIPRKPSTNRLREEFPPHQYKPDGGPAETLDAVLYEAERAHYALMWYEAALDGDKNSLEHALIPSEQSTEWKEEKRRYFRSRANRKNISYVDALADKALATVMLLIQFSLNSYAYPAIYPTINPMEQQLTPEQFAASWGARNLLGAMYLQFYWLITSGGTRCKYCGRLISQARPIVASSGKAIRKPRSDRQFCSDRCRHNFHYHNRRKPQRQSATSNQTRRD
jgi:hypothetical protein